MQQHPQQHQHYPAHPLHTQNHTSSFHSLLKNPSLSPLRTLLARAPSPANSSSPPISTRTPIPHIPQIHPGDYSTYKSVNKLLSTFTSRSIAKSRRLKARLPESTTDTYRSIHCGDQNCCFSSPYSFYRTRSSSGSRAKSRTNARSRSVSNPNLRLASLRSGEESETLSLSPTPSPSAVSFHPFRRSLTKTGSCRRANSLFEGSPPPAGTLLTPLYEYPEPIGPRSSSWLSKGREQERVVELERTNSVRWAKNAGVPINRNKTASQSYRPSALSIFSWTAASPNASSERSHGETRKDGGEREIAYEWDGAFGWTQACKECGRERCVMCSGVVFEQIVVEEETVTAVEGMFSICTPCVHGFCPGTKMWLRVRCARCGEVDCEGCEGDENLHGSEG